jgi:integrase
MRHRGKRRVLLFGPRAQEILSPFLDRAPDAYLFCPREAAGARGRVRGERYSTHAYSTAVARAASRAGVPRWGVNRLRHNAATRLREQFGWEVARIVLGHSSSDTTEIYAIEDYGKAARAMGETG